MRLFKYIFKLGQCDSTKSLSPSSMYKLQILNAFEIGSFSSSRYALAIHFYYDKLLFVCIKGLIGERLEKKNMNTFRQ